VWSRAEVFFVFDGLGGDAGGEHDGEVVDREDRWKWDAEEARRGDALYGYNRLADKQNT
jgi:serine/threonine protein phosphatase PrpC